MGDRQSCSLLLSLERVNWAASPFRSRSLLAKSAEGVLDTPSALQLIPRTLSRNDDGALGVRLVIRAVRPPDPADELVGVGAFLLRLDETPGRRHVRVAGGRERAVGGDGDRSNRLCTVGEGEDPVHSAWEPPGGDCPNLIEDNLAGRDRAAGAPGAGGPATAISALGGDGCGDEGKGEDDGDERRCMGDAAS